MSKYCPLTNETTKCTEHCKDCAREIYDNLKDRCGKAEAVTEEAIINDLGEEALHILKQYGFIEFCGVLNNRRMYAV